MKCLFYLVFISRHSLFNPHVGPVHTDTHTDYNILKLNCIVINAIFDVCLHLLAFIHSLYRHIKLHILFYLFFVYLGMLNTYWVLYIIIVSCILSVYMTINILCRLTDSVILCLCTWYVCMYTYFYGIYVTYIHM